MIEGDLCLVVIIRRAAGVILHCEVVNRTVVVWMLGIFDR